MNTLQLDFNKTALVLIDLQKAIVALPGGDKAVENAVKLVNVFREHQGFISFVRVDFHDGQDALKPITDRPPSKKDRPKDWAVLDPRLGVTDSDYVVTKRQWGAFFGTDLDLQLRRRGIDTIVLGGISTNIGVETTAREAFQYGYNQIFIEDAMTAHTEEAHQASVQFIFPAIGRVRTTEDFLNQVKE